MTHRAPNHHHRIESLLVCLWALALVVPACSKGRSDPGARVATAAAPVVTPVLQPGTRPLPPTKALPGAGAKPAAPVAAKSKPKAVAQLTPAPTTAPPFDPKTVPEGQAAPAASGGFAAAALWASLVQKGLKPFGPVDAVAVPGSLHTQGKVLWRHDYHAKKKGLGIACNDCHHDAKGKTGSSKYKKCGVCHRSQKSPRFIAAKDAYHRSCLGCHQKAVAAAAVFKGRAPTGCDGCHKK